MCINNTLINWLFIYIYLRAQLGDGKHLRKLTEVIDSKRENNMFNVIHFIV